jgi:hypothetical protein
MPKTRQAIIHELAEQLASMENENLAELLEFARWLNAEQQQAAMLAKMPPALSRQITTECS